MKLKSLTIVFALLAASCTAGFEELNKNPNQMEVGNVSPASLMPDIIYRGASGLVGQSYLLTNELMQYSVSANSTDAYHRYMIPAGTVASTWNTLARWAASADHMASLCGDEADLANFKAIALTLRAFYMQMLTDTFGDIPFSEAFQAMEGNVKPKFDSQRDIYLQLIKDLEEANSLYTTRFVLTDSQKNKDLLYGGNIMRWKRFTNSLLLRVLIRVSACNDNEISAPARIRRMFEHPDDWPVFTGLDDEAVMRFTGEDPNVNPYGSYNDVWFSNNRRAGESIINRMKDLGDPRLTLWCNQHGGVWKGSKSGGATREETGVADAASFRKEILTDYNSPYTLMAYDEVLFIWAESALKGYIDGGSAVAGDFYSKAIESSIRHWSAMPGNTNPVSEAAISQYIAKVPWDGSFTLLMNQKYLALFWVAFEPWAEYRRTGLPDLPIAPTTKNDGILPRRLPYPINSAATNSDNYADAVAILKNRYKGADDMKTPVWWSKYRVDNNL